MPPSKPSATPRNASGSPFKTGRGAALLRPISATNFVLEPLIAPAPHLSQNSVQPNPMTDSTNKSPLEKSLPTSCYLTDDFFVRERELIFCREWFLAGREEQLPNAGDHLVLDVAGESILVVRTKDGALRAHYNVCRHRGARLCPSPEDSADPNAPELSGGVLGASGIRCPYINGPTAWTANSSTRLTSRNPTAFVRAICLSIP